MNMTLKNRRFVLAIVWLALNLGLGLQTSLASTKVVDKLGVSKDVLVDRVENLSTAIDIQYTSVTERTIIRYTVNGKHESEKMLGRVNLYYPVIENEVYSRGLPDILKYIPIIESELNPVARSGAGAVGLWQFMKPTARMKNLIVNNTIDERKDPVKSTYAAIDYLVDLNEQFGDWTLAIAAYNCGPGNVRKAIRRSGSKNYWKLRSFLPKETQHYIPKLIAAAYLMNYYHYHDLIPATMNAELQQISSTTVFQKIDLKKLARELNLDIDVITQLNAEYTRKFIPKNRNGNVLDIPTNKLHTFYEIYQPQLLASLNPVHTTIVQAVPEQKRKQISIEKIEHHSLPLRIYSLREFLEINMMIAEAF